MKKESDNLEHLKGKNPFSVPDGYMEGLTARIMSQIPEKAQEEEAKTVSLMDRMRPWLYMAAVFAGLGLFFKAVVGFVPEGDHDLADSLLVHTSVSQEALNLIEDDMDDEDQEYLEYLETQYADYLLTEDLAHAE